MKNILLIISCFAALHAAAQKHKTPIAFSFLENSMYEDFSEPVIITDSAHVYAQADSSAQIIQTLHRADWVHLIAYGSRDSEKRDTTMDKATGAMNISVDYHREDWYRIDLGYGVGYVPAANIATHSFYGGSDLRYFIKSSYQTQVKGTWGTMIYTYSAEKHQYTDSLFLESFGAGTAAMVPNYWNHVNVLFSMTMINAYCGGGEQTVLIADVNGKLRKLLTSSVSYVEMTADREESQMWLPVKFGKSKILHLINGDTKKALDENAGTLNTYTIPASIQVPRSELAVLERTVHKGFTDKNGEGIMTSPGVFKETVKKTFEYYRWTGDKLMRVQ